MIVRSTGDNIRSIILKVRNTSYILRSTGMIVWSTEI